MRSVQRRGLAVDCEFDSRISTAKESLVRGDAITGFDFG
jgi:hypothetical protein